MHLRMLSLWCKNVELTKLIFFTISLNIILGKYNQRSLVLGWSGLDNTFSCLVKSNPAKLKTSPTTVTLPPSIERVLLYKCLRKLLTWQNCSPRTEFPISSKAGDQSPIPMTLGTTTMRAPLTPDLAGKPTFKIQSILWNIKEHQLELYKLQSNTYKAAFRQTNTLCNLLCT